MTCLRENHPASLTDADFSEEELAWIERQARAKTPI